MMISRFFRFIGQRTITFFREFGGINVLIGRIIVNLKHLFKDWDLFIEQCMQIGVQALPLVTVVSVFAGAVSSWQAAYQLEGLMPLDYLGSAAGKAILLEMGPVLTGLVIAGRNGASIAAEIGTMHVTEQIDALESMGIDPVRYLAVPRVLAATIMIPVVVIYADTIAMGGAFMVANVFYDQAANIFFNTFRIYFLPIDLIMSITKGFVFGFSTALLGVYVGLRTRGGAKGVGSAAIRSFVYSSATILVMDFILATVIL
jgi:phospholipid/cholesterol/gamma-HCH transport system permease protein